MTSMHFIGLDIHKKTISYCVSNVSELQRRNYSPSAIRGYLGAVRQFAEHFHCSPEQLGAEHLRRYQLYLLQNKTLETLGRDQWLAKRQLELLAVGYYHLVFSVPHMLVPLMWQNKRQLFSLLFEASAGALPALRLPASAQPKGMKNP